MRDKFYYERGYGGIEAFLAGVFVAAIFYFVFYPMFTNPASNGDPSICVLDPETSTESMIDPKDGKEYVLIKKGAPTIYAEIDYHFGRLGNVEIGGKSYPYYQAGLDDFHVRSIIHPGWAPGKGSEYRPLTGVSNLRFVDVSANFPKMDRAYRMLDIYLLKGTPIPDFIQTYCDQQLPTTSLILFQDSFGKSLPPLEFNSGTPADWNIEPCTTLLHESADYCTPLTNLTYKLFGYEARGNTFPYSVALFPWNSKRQYTFTAGSETVTYDAAFLINGPMDTIVLMNADPLAKDAGTQYKYAPAQIGPKIMLPANLHKKSDTQTYTEQLEGFLPIQIPPWSWWTPECKPAVYLYPKQEQKVNVQVHIKNGSLTYTDPVYPVEGWNVLAKPNGELRYTGKTLSDSRGKVNYPDGKLPYLYYEGKIEDSHVKKPEKGYVVAYDKLASTFDDLLPKLGLNEKETKEFKEYWFKALPKASYYFIGVLPQSQLDQNEPLTITPQEDTMIRVRLYFEQREKFTVVSPPTITTPERNGFTVVDWGGMVKTDKEHPFTCLQ